MVVDRKCGFSALRVDALIQSDVSFLPLGRR
jgi:hypothetical protein